MVCLELQLLSPLWVWSNNIQEFCRNSLTQKNNNHPFFLKKKAVTLVSSTELELKLRTDVSFPFSLWWIWRTWSPLPDLQISARVKRWGYTLAFTKLSVSIWGLNTTGQQQLQAISGSLECCWVMDDFPLLSQMLASRCFPVLPLTLTSFTVQGTHFQ